MAGGTELRQATRESLVRAAAEVFAEDGFEGARVQQIAARAGFTTGAIYANFNGKTGLLVAVLDEHGHEFIQTMAEQLRADGGDGDVVRALALTTQVGRHSPYQRILADACAVAGRDASVRDALLPLVGRVQAALALLIDQAQRVGRIDPDLSSEALVHFALTLLLGSVFVRAVALEQPPTAQADEVVRRFLEGFAPGRTIRMADVRVVSGG